MTTEFTVRITQTQTASHIVHVRAASMRSAKMKAKVISETFDFNRAEIGTTDIKIECKELTK